MLFKYLLAPIALAASVVCYPPNSGYGGNQSPSTRPGYNNNGVDFRSCTEKIRQVREPLAASCQRQSVQDATSKLDGLYGPIHTLSTKFHLSVRSDTRVAFKYTRSLVSLFVGFQGIVDTVGQYPEVFSGSQSQETIYEFNSEFEKILKDFSSAGVNIHQVFSQATNIRFDRWQQVGFTFPEKYGFYVDK